MRAKSSPEPDARPEYIDRGGDLQLAPPFRCDGALLRCFSLTADKTRLERLVATTLHRAGATHLSPLSSTVLFVVAEIQRATAGDGGRGGWLSETDVAFWVPVVDTRQRGRVSWFLPYVFVDNAYAMAAGREALGFAKTLGTFTLPPRGQDGAYGVDTLHLPVARSDDRYRVGRLLEVRPPGLPAPMASSGVDALRSIARLTPLSAAHLGVPGRLASAVLELGAFPQSREVPLVLLRQLRDVSDPARAAIQEVVEAPARLSRITGAGVLGGRRTLHIEPSDSHPIGEELGLLRDHPIDAAWWAEIDFVVDKGRTISSGRTMQPAAVTGERPRRIAVLGGGMGSLSAVLALTADPAWRSRYEITVYQMGHRLGGKCASSRRRDRLDRIEEHGLHVWFGSYARAFRLLRGCYAELARPEGHPIPTWRDAFIPQENFYLRERSGGRLSTVRLELPPRPGLPGDPDHDPDAEALRRAVPAVIEGVARELRRAVRGVDALRIGRLLRSLARLDLLSADGLARARDEIRAVLGDRSQPAIRHMLDLSVTTALGLLRDGALTRGLETLDGEELSDWLARHGAAPDTLESGLIRAFYDLLLATEASPSGGRDLAAGAAIRAALFVLNGYRGAYLWKMSAGMGEAVIAPIYEVLRRRGVRFEFFRRVTHLKLTADKRALDEVEMVVQARTRGEYEPLVDVDGLPCWPHVPRWDALEDGERLRECAPDFESPSSAPFDSARVALRAGVDFDAVILGIPVGALPSIATELVEAHPRWRTMLREVRTTATLGFQAWLTADARTLGRTTEGDLQGGDPGALSTYADMTHLLAAERRQAEAGVRHVAYFCGPLGDLPHSEEGSGPVRVKVQRFLEEGARGVWPGAYVDGRFDWSLLGDPTGGIGPARLDAQYIRQNVEGTDRYTLTVRGSTACRLTADGSGVGGLFLAGDWVRNGLDVGCIEGAVRAGEACAEAIERARLPGESAEGRGARGPTAPPTAWGEPVDEQPHAWVLS